MSVLLFVMSQFGCITATLIITKISTEVGNKDKTEKECVLKNTIKKKTFDPQSVAVLIGNID